MPDRRQPFDLSDKPATKLDIKFAQDEQGVLLKALVEYVREKCVICARSSNDKTKNYVLDFIG